jgi:hypothetical protein
MYIYNITFNVEECIEHEWKKYVKRIFIPKMLQTGSFQSALTSKILVEEMQGISYSIQFKSKNKEKLHKFINGKFNEILTEIHQKFSPKMVYFATEMLVIDEQ